MPKDVIIACDFPDRNATMGFLNLFGEMRPYIKIGMELFYAEGPGIVRELKDRGHKIFLDVKVHDIPNTVKKTMAVLGKLGVDMVNLHAAGTGEMMRAAKDGLMEGASRQSESPVLIAVTQLTSTDHKHLKEEILIDRPIEDVVVSYAGLARKSGLDGVVCSPLEAEMVHRACDADFLTVTPGIRFTDVAQQDDQKRITTPKQARELGSDYIVVGRPIIASEDPVAAYMRCREEFLAE